MQRVLIIAENSLQQERLCSALKFDRSVQLTTANLRQINPKTLQSFTQSDLIILEDTSEQGDPRTMEYLLSSLKTTGLPIVLLPSIEDRFASDKEPLVLNLTETSVAKPGLAALINKIRVQYTSQGRHQIGTHAADSTPLLSQKMVESEPKIEPAVLSDRPAPSDVSLPQTKTEELSKLLFALTAMGRISKQLRGPLSNMNLAIHMLSKAQSIEERDRYVRLLREEYQRELQLINELENLHASVESKL